ncbi:MAG: radical SAM protein [Coriobacteriia bacterium]|nr:radical SAM protein [Coriobacteriia bacterium]
MTAGPLRIALLGLSSPSYQSLALGYLRAFAEADPQLAGRVGFQTLDLTVDLDPWWVAFRVVDMQPDVLGISVTCWNATKVYELCDILRKAMPQITIVLGGPEVGPIAERVLERNPAVDIVVRGEGEETFAELLDTLSRGGKPWRVEGVTARREGAIASAPDRCIIGALDSVPSPYLSGVCQPLGGSAYVETYRGCPHRCGYCFEGKGYGRVRCFSDARVEAEVAAIVGSGVRTFSFIDPVFNLTRERLVWLAGLMEPYAQQGVRLHTIEVDIERIGAGEAALLKKAGVMSVETGPQTVGSAALDICRRSFDRDRFAAGVGALRAEGISVECDFIVGLPGDTLQDFLDGLRFALALDPGKIQMSTLHVLPGTDLWERADELGLVFREDPPHEVVCTAQMSFTDLRRAEVLGSSVVAQYRARTGPPVAGAVVS